MLARRLLWVDCVGAGLAGATVIALSDGLSDLEGLPRGVLLFTGAMNLLYGSYSLSLAVRAERPLGLLKLLVGANLAWAVVCLGLAAAFSETATPFAYVHLVGEAVYVGGLAVLEWQNRDRLLVTAEPTAAGRRGA